MKSFKAFLLFALLIWIGGAAYFSFQIEAKRNRECIDEQGLIAGVFSCEGLIAVESQFTQNLILSLNWPLELFRPAIVYKSIEFNDPQNSRRELFLCNYAAYKLEFTDDVDGLALVTLSIGGKPVDYKTLEIWRTDVKAWAAYNDSRSRIEGFYKNFCEKRFSVILETLGNYKGN